MSESSTYQQIRSHLAYLRLSAAAEALPGELDHARQEGLGHSDFLARLLEIEVSATEIRRPDCRVDGESHETRREICKMATVKGQETLHSLRPK